MGKVEVTVNLFGKIKTEAQKAALEKLTAYADLFFSDKRSFEKYFECRVRPLIIGPTGSGKSFLVRELANSGGYPMFRATYGDWLVRGCKEGTPTITQVGVFVESNQRGIIHVDELDKVGKPQSGSDWMRSVNVELYNLIDGRPTASDDSIESTNWPGSLQKKFRQHFLVIGTATFQQLFQSRPQPGFISDALNAGTWGEQIQKRLRRQEEISIELLERFNDNLIIIPPLTKAEAVQILELINDTPPYLFRLPRTELDKLANQAVESGSNMRFFEELITEMALQAQIRKPSARSK